MKTLHIEARMSDVMGFFARAYEWKPTERVEIVEHFLSPDGKAVMFKILVNDNFQPCVAAPTASEESPVK